MYHSTVIAYQDRLRSAMERANMTSAALARSMGLSYQAVKQVLDGKSKAFSALNNSHAALALGVDANWLATGQGSMQEATRQPGYGGAAPATPITSKVRYCPLVNLVQIATGLIASHAMQVEVASSALSQDAFFLVIAGDSMEPELHDGDFLLIEPCVHPEPGDCVVAIDTTHKKAYLSKYRLRGINPSGEDVFDLVPLNDYYPTIRSEEQQLTIVGTAIELRRRFRSL